MQERLQSAHVGNDMPNPSQMLQSSNTRSRKQMAAPNPTLTAEQQQ